MARDHPNSFDFKLALTLVLALALALALYETVFDLFPDKKMNADHQRAVSSKRLNSPASIRLKKSTGVSYRIRSASHLSPIKPAKEERRYTSYPGRDASPPSLGLPQRRSSRWNFKFFQTGEYLRYFHELDH